MVDNTEGHWIHMASPAHQPLTRRQAQIIAHAAVALDGQGNAMRWLETPNRGLEDRTPFEVLSGGRPEDLELVDELLSALEYGLFV